MQAKMGLDLPRHLRRPNPQARGMDEDHRSMEKKRRRVHSCPAGLSKPTTMGRRGDSQEVKKQEDPLAKMDRDLKEAKPMPSEVRRQLAQLLRKQ